METEAEVTKRNVFWIEWGERISDGIVAFETEKQFCILNQNGKLTVMESKDVFDSREAALVALAQEISVKISNLSNRLMHLHDKDNQ